MTRTANQSIVLQSIEFWSTICEIEITKKKEVFTAFTFLILLITDKKFTRMLHLCFLLWIN